MKTKASKEDALTDAEAEAMLRRLSAHYRQPVQPIGRYCDGLRTWQKALQDRYYRARATLFPGLDAEYKSKERESAWEAYRFVPRDPYKAAYAAGIEPGELVQALSEMRRLEQEAESVAHVFLQITKSDLLYRLLYKGEKLRSEMCPEHQGKWCGSAMLRGCAHGCGGTGWLPERANDLGAGI